jgi:hypothetical protein
MNTKPVDAIAKAVLYEGYMLYPYRPSSVKNRQRFNFGVLYPDSYGEVQAGSDASKMQTECLLQGASFTAVEVRVRFLKLVSRSVRDSAEPRTSEISGVAPADSPFEFEANAAQPWQEAIECDVAVPACNLDALTTTPVEWKFSFPAKQESEPDSGGRLVTRKQKAVQGTVEIEAVRAAEGIFKLRVRVKNLTSLEDSGGNTSREAALMLSLVSAHTVLGVVDGQFVSLLEPPEDLNALVQGCQNIGTYPVLVGAAGERDTMLSSPIILYDYPQIAPESPGDLFDGTEIDEILALRIMTMTDAEKDEMRNGDERARNILERTEALPMESLRKLHGTLRELRPVGKEMP